MDFITIATGDELDVRHPQADQITATSISWALSQINRFNGHARRPYSVAEHSLLVCEIAERELGLGVHGLFAALMHDAHEAFCGDMHSPGKQVIGPAWAQWEDRWERLVRRCFTLHTSATSHREAIHRADLMALATEKRDLLPDRATSAWPVLTGYPPVAWVDLMAPERVAASWEDWRDRFHDRLHELQEARTALHLPALTSDQRAGMERLLGARP